MQNQAPLEVVIGLEVELYLAPHGTASPAVDETPLAPWVKVGKNGHLNYTQDGVTVTHEQSTSEFKPLGSTVPVKSWRVSEGAKFGVTLADLSIEQYAKALNDAAITTTAAGPGVAGTKAIDLYRGSTINNYAFLLRFPSVEMEEGAAQYAVPKVYQSGNPSPVFKDDGPAALALEFAVLYDNTADHPCGELVVQTDDAES